MTIRVGDKGELVRKWREVMAAEYAGYERTQGKLPTDTDVFGSRAEAWQKEFERRTKQKVDGEVSDADLAKLGIANGAPSPDSTLVIFTSPGSGAEWWIGPSFEVGEWAKRELGAEHWPLGYPKGGYLGLMGGDPRHSYLDVIGFCRDELARRIREDVPSLKSPKPGTKIVLSGYSQSAEGIAVAAAELFGDGGEFEHLRPYLVAVILFGSPIRQEGPTKVGNNPVGSGISRKDLPAWLQAVIWDVVTETPNAPDFYAACDDDIRPLFYEWFVEAETELPFVIYTAQVIIPAILNFVAPFAGVIAPNNPLVTIPLRMLGLTDDLIIPLLRGIAKSKEEPNPELVKLLSVEGVLKNLPNLLTLLKALPGIQTHGEYHIPKPEFNHRTGIQVGCDVVRALI